MKMHDITAGKTYGKLTFIETVEQSRFVRQRDHHGLWRCECGKTKRIRVGSVVGGSTRSCGCANQAGMRAIMRASYAESVSKRKVAT